MLSYRHSFHAGNFADVLKHIVVVEILAYLTQKEKPFEYIDTHSGAGLFRLDASDAQKLQEYQSGIGKLFRNKSPELARYLDVVKACNPTENLAIYPGSPTIATHFLRPQDRAWLYELHPQDYKRLCDNMAHHKKVRVFQQDGLKSLDSRLPPHSRRALILIDPSYEVKSEYEQVFTVIAKAYKKFSTGIYALWYPVVERKKIDLLTKKMSQSGIKNIQRFEFGIMEDSQEHGMTASGMFVINPPWMLFDTMSMILPKLNETLTCNTVKASFTDKSLCYKCDIITDESGSVIG